MQTHGNVFHFRKNLSIRLSFFFSLPIVVLKRSLPNRLMMESDVASLAKELARAVEITMNPTASHHSRMEAYVACER